MTPEQYAQVKAAFAETIRLPPHQRSSFLRKQVGSDPEVLGEVESLIAHHIEATQRLDATTQFSRINFADPNVASTFKMSESEDAETRPASRRFQSQLLSLGPIGLLPLGGFVVCLLLAIVVMVGHTQFRSIVRERRAEDVQSVLSFVEQSIENWVSREKSEVERLLAASEFRQIVIDLNEELVEGGQATPEERQILRSSIDEELEPYLGPTGGYAIWDSSLTKHYDTRSDHRDSSVDVSEYGATILARVMQGETVVLFPGQRKDIAGGDQGFHPTPWVRVISPLYGNDGEILAVILLRSPRVALEFSQSLASLRIGSTGEALAFDASGLLLTESRFADRFAALGILPEDAGGKTAVNLQLRAPPVDLREKTLSVDDSATWPMTQLVKHAANQSSGHDLDGYKNYMGYPAHGAWRWLPEHEIVVAYEVSLQEANGPYRLLQLVSAFIVGLTVCCLAALAIAVYSVSRLRRKIDRLEIVGSYTLLDKIGEGGMGQVFRARHSLLKRPTAVKLLKPEVRSRRTTDLFEAEVQIASQLMHPNTIQIYDYGESENGHWYYAMEYIDGRNLEQLAADEAPFSTDRLIDILLQVAAAMGEAHANGIIHRDIKPQNIMVTRRAGMIDFVKVLDFGLATVLGPRKEGDEIKMAGTVRYMAPECFLTPQSIGPPSDVFSLAAVAYEMMSGFKIEAVPLVDTGQINKWAERLERLCKAFPASEREGSDVHNKLRFLIIASMAVNPRVRPKDANDFLQQLKAIRG